MFQNIKFPFLKLQKRLSVCDFLFCKSFIFHLQNYKNLLHKKYLIPFNFYKNENKLFKFFSLQYQAKFTYTK